MPKQDCALSFGVTRACGLIRISRSLYRYRSRRPACAELRERICEIAATKRRYGPFERKPLPKPLVANDSWSMDFMSDGLADGRRLRCLTIVDDCTRES